MLLNDAAQQVGVQKLKGPDYIGTSLTRGNRRTEIYYNLEADGRRMHVNSNNNLGGFETDAYILAVNKENGADAEYMMIYGSYLRKSGQSVHESYQKQFLSGKL